MSRTARRGRHQAERTRRRKRRLAVLVVLALLVLPFVAAAGWFWWQIDPLSGTGADVVVEVEQDWGVSEIADELSDQGVIGSPLAFKVYAKVTGGGSFQAGTYDLQKNMGARGAISALERGPRPTPRGNELALPPGLTLEDIAARVGKLPGLSAERFLEVAGSGAVRSKYQPTGEDDLEGLLYPDTYFVSKNQDEEDIIELLVETFDEKATAAGLQDAPSVGLTPYEAVIVASLIQNESGIPEELPQVSAVIQNRLEDRELLQIDYTLCYAKGGCPPEPTNADKRIDSPYNTYRYPGLPPTPISSVTEATIRAAVSPADVDYKFYVLTDEEGHHAFAETLNEHERNIADARERGVL
ncbi:MAG: endolytic transglycosylase MltG [Acidimicrobiia bacterium]